MQNLNERSAPPRYAMNDIARAPALAINIARAMLLSVRA